MHHEPAPISSASAVRRCRSLARRSAIAGAAIGASVFLTWLLRPLLPFNLGWLWLMKANTALCLAACGASLAARLDRAGPRLLATARALASAVALVGAATLLEYSAGLDLRIDRLISADLYSPLPGRMAPATAAAFLLLGAAVALLGSTRGPASWACDAAIIAAGIVLQLVLCGYLFHQIALVGVSDLTRTAPHTLLALSLIWLAALLARARSGLFSVLGRSGPGSTVARFLLPATLLIPIALSMLRAVGDASGWYSAPLGIAIFAAIQSVFLAALVLAFGAALNHSDRQLRLAQTRHDELERMIAVCAWTRRIRWHGAWVSIETFLSQRFGLSITHGISEEALADLLAAHSTPKAPQSPPGSTCMPDE